MAGLSGRRQVWVGRGWVDRFGLPFDASDTGVGHDSEMVAAVTADAATLLGYFEDVHDQTLEVLGSLDDAELGRVVDDSWSPPVTLGSRLVSVVVDDLQHVGQAAYVRGLLQRR